MKIQKYLSGSFSRDRRRYLRDAIQVQCALVVKLFSRPAKIVLTQIFCAGQDVQEL